MHADERQWLISNPIVLIMLAFLIGGIGAVGWQGGQEERAALWFMLLPLAGLSMLWFGSLHLRAGDALAMTSFPIWRRTIPWNDIRDAHAVRYDAWRYGGWGIRFSKGTVAYSVWSRQAIRFSVVGRKLDVVVTTRRPRQWLMEVERRSSGVLRSPEEPANTRRSSD